MYKESIIQKNITALKCVGLWPIEGDSKYKFVHQIYSIALTTWFTIYFFTEVVNIYAVRNNPSEVMMNFSFTFLNLLLVCKVFTTLFERKKLNGLVATINRVDADILNGDDSENKSIVRQYISASWMKTYTLTIFVLLALVTGCCTTLLDAHINGLEEITFKNGTPSGRFKKTYLMSSWFPFDENSDEYYPYAYGYQIFCAGIACFYFSFWNSFIFTLISFAIGQFQILQSWLRNIYDDDSYDRTNADSLVLKRKVDKRIQSNFRKCVIHHYLIINYAETLDKIISPIMFIEFTVVTLMLISIGLRGILEGPSTKLAFTGVYLMCVLAEIFGFYWHANELTLQGLQVADAIWDSKWYECSISIQKGLLLMMMRAQIKVTLSIGPFSVMSLETFIMILKSAYSYMAFIREFYK